MIKIFIITHKVHPPLVNELYIPLQVGKEGNIYPSILKDNTLDNISKKNDSFSELTAAYWLWKNYDEIKYIGFCHYRRYFNFYPSLFYKRNHNTIRISGSKFLTTRQTKTAPEKQQKKIIKLLSEYDIIVPKAIEFKFSILNDYKKNHRVEDLLETQKIITFLHPEYESSLKNLLNNKNYLHVGNMFITSKKIWDEYHEWLFSILFELEKKIEIQEDNYQRRVFGFIAERLFNLYIDHNNLKKKEIQTYFIEN